MTKRARAGRPPIGEKAMRSSFSVSVTREKRTRLDKSARESGLSLSQEINRLLDKAFEAENSEERLYGPSAQRNIFRMLAAAAALIEARTGKLWTEDFDTHFAVSEAWLLMLPNLLRDTRPMRSKNLVERVQRFSERRRELEKLEPGAPTTPEEAADYEARKAEWTAKKARLNEEFNYFGGELAAIEKYHKALADEATKRVMGKLPGDI